MTALRERMIEDLQLHGLSNNTQLCYVRSCAVSGRILPEAPRPDHRRRTTGILSLSHKRKTSIPQYLSDRSVWDQILL